MNSNEIMKIFEDTAYVRMGGSSEEPAVRRVSAGQGGGHGPEGGDCPL